jgi:2-keto-4-pentenoate hydratase/2-oxohepta-3-ene-1,7-dioic acid hydratase in catechol pathway
MCDPKVFMKTGDLIEIEVSGLGCLSNRIAAE